MQAIDIDAAVHKTMIDVLKQVALFQSLGDKNLEIILQHGQCLQFDPDEVILQKNAPSEAFYLILKGEVAMFAERDGKNRKRLTTLGIGATVGDIGVLLGKVAGATAVAKGEVRTLKFSSKMFFNMFERIPNFGLALAKTLATRLEDFSGQVALPRVDEPREYKRRVTDMLPPTFMQQHRVLPIRIDKDRLTLGFVNEPTNAVLESIYSQLPGLDIVPVQISLDYFDAVIRARSEGRRSQNAHDRRQPDLGPKLRVLLERMAAEGASDLHITEGVPPRWRIDGDLHFIEGSEIIEVGELRQLFDPVMEERHRREFEDMQDTDFGYGIRDLARFRINLFRDLMGACAGIRQIPSRILSVDSLAHSQTLKHFCSLVNGLVLVTGPTGSGKTTTIAAMIDHINQQFARHIITLEDPIEFVYENDASVINQREVGGHTPSFQRGLHASMREDPDVILVGEIVDLETLDLVLDSASTGHLVFSTLHTNSAVSTVDRMIDMFPPAQHVNIRTKISEILRGVVCQTLCKRVSGGRLAAFEIMVVTRAVANLIRDGKTVQIPNIMQTAKGDGHVLLNESLRNLVKDGVITQDEALKKAIDRIDLANRLKNLRSP